MSEIELFEMECSIDDQKNKPDINSLSLFQEIERTLGENLSEEKSEGDSTDEAFSFIENLTNKLQTEFDETIEKDGGEKQLIRFLTKIFIILLNTKVDSVDKIKKKNYRQCSRKNMVRTKLTVRRWPRTSFIPHWRMKKRQQKKDRQPFKIKTALPEQKTADIKKNGNVRKTISVRQKSKYFSDRSARNFFFVFFLLNIIIFGLFKKYILSYLKLFTNLFKIFTLTMPKNEK